MNRQNKQFNIYVRAPYTPSQTWMKITLLVHTLNELRFFIPQICQFPFTYLNVTHHECTYDDHNAPWCSITVDDAGNYDGLWGECDLGPNTKCSGDSLVRGLF